MRDIRIKLDGKNFTNETEYIVYSVYVPKENKQQQTRFFPFTGEWSIDLTTVREDTPLLTSIGYYGGRSFKVRKYIFCTINDGIFELVFTDSKRKFENFVIDRKKQENGFLDDLRKKAQKRLAEIKAK